MLLNQSEFTFEDEVRASGQINLSKTIMEWKMVMQFIGDGANEFNETIN